MRPQTKLTCESKHVSLGGQPTRLSFRCEAKQDALDIFVYGVVGDVWGDGIDAKTVQQELIGNRGKSVTVRVNSPGGLAYDGIAIFNALQSHDGPTTGIIEGMAGSAASLLIMACDTIKAHQGSSFAPHYSLCVAYGHRHEIQDCLIAMEKLDGDLEKMYAARSGNPIDVVKRHLEGPNKDGTRFTAEEALAAGYVDEVIKTQTKTPHGSKPKNTVGADRLRMWKRVLTPTK